MHLPNFDLISHLLSKKEEVDEINQFKKRYVPTL